MQQWEYKHILLTWDYAQNGDPFRLVLEDNGTSLQGDEAAARPDELGKQGWELLSSSGFPPAGFSVKQVLWFKRPLQE